MLFFFFLVAISFIWHLKQVKCSHVGAQFKRVLCHKQCKYLQSKFFSFISVVRLGSNRTLLLTLITWFRNSVFYDLSEEKGSAKLWKNQPDTTFHLKKKTKHKNTDSISAFVIILSFLTSARQPLRVWSILGWVFNGWHHRMLIFITVLHTAK